MKTVKGYMKHERKVLAEVTKMRSQSMKAQTPEEQGRAEGALSPRGASGRRQEGRDGEQCDGQGHGDADGPEAAHLFEAREVASRQGREGDRRGQAARQE